VDGSAHLELRAAPLERSPAVAHDRAKRAFDVIFSALLLLFFLPMMALLCVAIKLESPGPALFRQARGGLDGRRFQILKFRTMRCLEDGAVITQARRDDERVTRLGRFLRMNSIDELPQLINVLRGEMSLIGPRPHALSHDAYYSARLSQYRRRYLAKPGITGLAQVRGLRGPTQTVADMGQRVDSDLEYIASWSLWLDFKIALKTIPSLLDDTAY